MLSFNVFLLLMIKYKIYFNYGREKIKKTKKSEFKILETKQTRRSSDTALIAIAHVKIDIIS